MDPAVARQLLTGLRKRKQLELRSETVNQLFSMGCGFTKFLTHVFIKLSCEEMLRARLVCSTWKRFIEEHVWFRYRSILWILKEFPEIKVSILYHNQNQKLFLRQTRGKPVIFLVP
jgi:hypothetical protein